MNRSLSGADAVPLLFALTMFVSATLLFLVQPMIGKMVLPLLGGTPAVWNTCMVFYQSLLLLGYFYAHKSTANLDVKKQSKLHAFILLGALAVLLVSAVMTAENSPIPIVKSLSPQGDNYPFFGVIVLLTVAIGMPFFVVSTSAPLLQKWFAETGHPSARDPYFLYAASNFGSLLALIAYPTIVEPNLRLIHQAWLWAIGYALLVALVVACARIVNRGPVAAPPTAAKVKPVASTTPVPEEEPPSIWRKLRWMALAFVPSSLMLGITTFVSTDMVSIPLLWIIPLSLYLITFIIVFAKVPQAVHVFMTLLMPVMVLLIAFLMTSRVPAKFGLQVLMHMCTFFVVTMVCHGELARDRPSTKHLTSFYLLMSAGGMLGGLFNALVAPIIFTFTSEYPLTLVAACFLLPSMFQDRNKTEGEWTRILDVLLPLGMFFLCSQAQTYQSEITYYVYHHGKFLVTALTLFALPMLVAIFVFEKTLRSQIALGALAGGSLLLYALPSLFMDRISLLQQSQYGSELLGAIVPVAFRFLPVVLSAGTYVWYCRRFEDRQEASGSIVVGLVALTVSFAAMVGLANLVNDKVMTDIAFKANIGASTVRQILIFGVPAMICYFFVERPVRFGAAVAAFWFATFYYERGGFEGLWNNDDSVVYDRSFFGRLRIDTTEHWKYLPPELFPAGIEDDQENYVIERRETDNSLVTYLTPRGQHQREYLIETVQTEKGLKTTHYRHRAFTTLLHGTTTHGLQEKDRMRTDICRALWVFHGGNVLEAASALEAGAGEAMQFPGRDPTSYYHRTGPVGSMFEAFNYHNRLKDHPNLSVACIGLGTGSLSAYGHPGQRMTFFEIDTHVRKIVEPGKYFRYLDDAKRQGVEIDFIMGDARVSLERIDRKFGFMLVDAFSSDAIPAHLLTKQAFELFFQRLEDDGILAVHVSNRYLDLEPVVERICRELKLECRVMHGLGDPVDALPDRHTDDDASWYSNFRFASTWIAIAKTKEALGAIEEDALRVEKQINESIAELEQKSKETLSEENRRIIYASRLAATRERWIPLTRKDNVGLWTDDFSPIIPILRGEWRFWTSSSE